MRKRMLCRVLKNNRTVASVTAGKKHYALWDKNKAGGQPYAVLLTVIPELCRRTVGRLRRTVPSLYSHFAQSPSCMSGLACRGNRLFALESFNLCCRSSVCLENIPFKDVVCRIFRIDIIKLTREVVADSHTTGIIQNNAPAVVFAADDDTGLGCLVVL